MHAADVQPQSKVIVIPEEITEALPLNVGIRRAEIRETHLDERTHSDEVIQDLTKCPWTGTAQLVSANGTRSAWFLLIDPSQGD